MEQEYRDNAPYLGLMSPDEAKERLRLDLEIEARMQLYQRALSKLKAKAKIEIRLKEPEIQRVKVADTDHTPKGSLNASIIIFEFSDFQCPFCRKSYEVLKRVTSEYKDSVKLIYKYFPLRTDPRSLAPSIAAYCADKQGRFWEFHDSLFSAADLTLTTIKKIANSHSLNTAEFDLCVGSGQAKAAVMSDLNEAIQLGIDSTPTFVINGKIYSGMLDYAEFKTILEKEITETTKASKNE